GKLPPGGRGGGGGARRRLLVFQLDDRVLPADDVGAAVQQAGGRDAAGKRSVDLHVFGVDHVADTNFGDDRQGEFVHAAGDGKVGVGVDDPRHDEHAVGVDG